MTRGTRIGLLLVALLGGFIFFLLTVGSLGEPQPDVIRINVGDVLGAGQLAARYGDEELRISGWYAELDADCIGLRPSPSKAGWLSATCPMRVLMPYQPAQEVTQAELEANGMRLAAPTNAVFPSRARPEGANLRLQQLVFVGHFSDPAAADCPIGEVPRCRDTFVVSDYDGLLR